MAMLNRWIRGPARGGAARASRSALPLSEAQPLRRWLLWAARALLIVLALIFGFGCSDSPLRGLDDIAHVKGPPSEVPDPAEGCPDYDAAALPPDVDVPGASTVAAGTVAGSFSVSSTGSAVYTIPILAPPARAAMQPHLSLSVDGSDESVLGVGVRLSGGSAVTRCPKTLAQHGEIRRVVDDPSDALCLDEKLLVPVDPSSEKPLEYRTFPDAHSKVVVDYGEGSGWDPKRGPMAFRVLTKAGLTYEYGTAGSGWVFARNDVVRSWLLTAIRDPSGNTISWSYINEKHPTEGYTVEHAPWRIEYTGHPLLSPSRAVQFVYGARESPSARTLYARGMALKRSLYLQRIEMLVGYAFAKVREYRMSYTTAPATKRMLLTHVQECAADGACKPATELGWHHGSGPGFVELATPLKLPESDLASMMLADITGDGLDDIVVPDVDMTGGSEQPMTDWMLAPNRSAEVTPSYFDTSSLAFPEAHGDVPYPVQPERGTPLDYNHECARQGG